MSDEDDKQEEPSYESFQNEMFRAYRTEGRRRRPATTPAISFRETLVLRLFALRNWLSSQGWPEFTERVVVTGAHKNNWESLPAGYAQRLRDDGIDPAAEVPGQFESGINFITRRALKFSEDYWAVQEADAIQRVLKESNLDAAIRAAFELGRLTQKAASQRFNIRHVRKAVKQNDALFFGVANSTNRDRREKAKKWQAAALEHGQNVLVNNPNLTVSSAA